MLEQHSGRVLAVDEEVTVLEGSWPYGRTVIIEFPTVEHLEAWYGSAAYAEIAAFRHLASDGNAVVVRGRP